MYIPILLLYLDFRFLSRLRYISQTIYLTQLMTSPKMSQLAQSLNVAYLGSNMLENLNPWVVFIWIRFCFTIILVNKCCCPGHHCNKMLASLLTSKEGFFCMQSQENGLKGAIRCNVLYFLTMLKWLFLDGMPVKVLLNLPAQSGICSLLGRDCVLSKDLFSGWNSTFVI